MRDISALRSRALSGSRLVDRCGATGGHVLAFNAKSPTLSCSEKRRSVTIGGRGTTSEKRACWAGVSVRAKTMGIRKHEFYEGAALHRLACSGAIPGIRCETPFFLLNGELLVYLKYSTRVRSPWGFTFTADEQASLEHRSSGRRVVIGLVCGHDGIAALDYELFQSVAGRRNTSLHLSCARRHGEHYAISGPDGDLPRKVPPSLWRRLLGD